MAAVDWYLTKDGDTACRTLYEHHYSKRRYRDGRRPKLFVGPGEKIVLRTFGGDAMFVWRKFKDSGINIETGERMHGINNSIFRNDNPKTYLSSDLIRQADAIADLCWPGERHYTYVNATRIRSTNPGFCYLAAGWKRIGRTKGGLEILARDLSTDQRE